MTKILLTKLIDELPINEKTKYEFKMINFLYNHNYKYGYTNTLYLWQSNNFKKLSLRNKINALYAICSLLGSCIGGFSYLFSRLWLKFILITLVFSLIFTSLHLLFESDLVSIFNRTFISIFCCIYLKREKFAKFVLNNTKIKEYMDRRYIDFETKKEDLEQLFKYYDKQNKMIPITILIIIILIGYFILQLQLTF